MEDLPLDDIPIVDEEEGPVQQAGEDSEEDIRGDSNALFHALDADGSELADQDEIATFVTRNSKLWAMQSVNFGLPIEKSQQLATQVAMELATGLRGQEALQAKITRRQFHRFRKEYIRDQQGTREFFWRTIFAYYDEDNNSEIDESELDKMLEALYDASFFLEHEGELKGALLDGNLRLPPKEELKTLVLEETRYSDHGLTFDIFFRFLRSIREGDRKREEAAKAEREAAAKERQKAILEGIKPEEKEVIVGEEVGKKPGNEWGDCVLCEWLEDLCKNFQK